MQMRACRNSWESRGLLVNAHIYEGRSCSAEAEMFDVADYADDLPGTNFVDRIRVVSRQDLLADGIFVQEELAHEFFVDDDDPGSGFGVVFIEIAAFEQGNLQRRENVSATSL